MGDLTTLADSIRREGLLQPIGVTDRLELVVGNGGCWPTGTSSSLHFARGDRRMARGKTIDLRK